MLRVVCPLPGINQQTAAPRNHVGSRNDSIPQKQYVQSPSCDRPRHSKCKICSAQLQLGFPSNVQSSLEGSVGADNQVSDHAHGWKTALREKSILSQIFLETCVSVLLLTGVPLFPVVV